MQFIRLPNQIDIAARKLPGLVPDWMNMKCEQSLNIYVVQKLWVNMLISWGFEYSTSWTPHWCTFRNCTHRPRAIWDVNKHNVFWIIPDPGRQKKITSSLESISKIPFQVGTRYGNILECGQDFSNRGNPCLVFITGTFQGTWNHPNENPDALLRCTVDIILHITNGKMQRPGILIAWRIGHLSLIGCPNECHNRWSGRTLILHIPPPFTGVHLSVYLATSWVCEEHWYRIDVRLKRDMCWKKLNLFETVPVV